MTVVLHIEVIKTILSLFIFFEEKILRAKKTRHKQKLANETKIS